MTRQAPPTAPHARAPGLLDPSDSPSLARLCRIAARLLDAESAHVTVLRDEQLRVAATTSAWPAAVDPSRFEAVTRDVLARGVPCVAALADDDADARSSSDARLDASATCLGVPLATGRGEPAGALCVVDTGGRPWTTRDVEGLTELAAVAAAEFAHRQAADAAAEREARFRAVLDAIPVGVFITDAQGAFVEVNRRVAEIWGGAPAADSVDAYAQYRARWPATGAAVRPEEWPLSRALQHGERVVGERIDITRFDGAPAVILNHAAPIRDERGAIVGAVVAITDITAQIAAEEVRIAAVEASRVRIRAAFDAMPGSMAIIDAETGRLLEFNDAACAALGYSRAEFAQLSIPDLDAQPDRAIVLHLVRAAARLDARRQFRRQHRTKSGEIREVLVTTRAFDDLGGRRVACTWIDVTEQAALEAEARAQTAVLETVLANIPILAVLIGADGAIQWVSGEWERVLGWSVEAMRVERDILERFYPDPAESAAARAFMAEAPGEWRRFAPRAITGEAIVSSWTNVRLPDGRLLGIGCDERPQQRVEAERARAVEALRASEQRYALAAQVTRSAIWEWDVATGAMSRAPGGAAIFGYDSADVAQTFAWWESRVHPEDLPGLHASLRAAATSPDVAEWRGAYRFRRADGAWASVEDRGCIVRDEAGNARTMIGAMQDVTEQRLLETRLRQAQKMEAVGQLAGGIAHDFNNLLTVIQGNLEFALGDLPPEATGVRVDLEEVGRAADRARALVRQLLTFSRRRPLQVRHADVGEVLADAERMLRRVIGEEIVLDVALPDREAAVAADAGQLEQVFMNLVVNARDAMLTPLHGHPGAGGVLTISAEVVASLPADAQLDVASRRATSTETPPREPEAGWVAIAVRDDGHGMTAETAARALEPFFTTKATGHGTGLGLATVHGIVRDANGVLLLESAPGAGTTVRIYLPRVPLGEPVAPPSREQVAAHAGRTVLLVEDEAPVRAMARRLLERHGYRVVEARHGRDALEIWRARTAPIDAVITDLRMPELGGGPLVRALRAEAPALPVVFVSGYVDAEGTPDALADAAFVDKPFTAATLLAALDAVLTVPPRS